MSEHLLNSLNSAGLALALAKQKPTEFSGFSAVYKFDKFDSGLALALSQGQVWGVY